MVEFGQTRIGMIQMVRRYSFQGGKGDIRYKQFVFEDAFKEWFPSSPVVTPGIEMAPPDAPRFVFQNNKINMLVAGVATQLTLTFDDGLPTIASIEKLLKKYSVALDRGLMVALGEQSPTYSGIVVHVNRPFSGDEADVAKAICDNLITPKFGDVRVANIDLGFLRDGVMCSLNVSGYRTFSGVVKPGESMHIDSDFSKPDESGLQIKVDANTKPSMNDASGHEFVNLVPHVLGLLTVHAKSFLGELMPEIGV